MPVQENALMKRQSTLLSIPENESFKQIVVENRFHGRDFTLASRFLGLLHLKSVLQRLPGIFTILFVLLCFFGPVFTPTAYSVYFSWLHIYFLWSTIRTFMSSLHVYRSVVSHTKTNWKAKYKKLIEDRTDVLKFEQVFHVIIIPQYKEEMDIMTETLSVLASHSMAKTNYKICLAMEQGEKEAPEKAAKLIEFFADAFHEIVFTLHPKGIPGEIRGKSSNTAWAAKEMISCNNGPLPNQVFTVMDADTCFAADYFEAISCYYASAGENERDLIFFSTPTLFDRNADKVPFLVRAYDMQWSMGVLSNYYPFSVKQAPCSAYSMSANLSYGIGLWDVDAGAIGEDLHMFLKCFYSTQGQMKVQPIFSPASQCNIEGGNYWKTITARYTQSKRHMFAALDVGYVVRRFLFGIFAPGYDAPYKNSQVVHVPLSPLSKYAPFSFLCRAWSIMYTVFEGHFFVTQTLVMIATSSILIPPGLIPSVSLSFWSYFTTAPVDPTLATLNVIANYIRIIGTIFFIGGVYFYEKYQTWSGVSRWQSEFAQSLGIRPKLQFKRPWYAVFDWFAIPITGILYLVLPQLQVHVSQIFTENLDYVVAAKPTVTESALHSLANHPAALNRAASCVTVVVVNEEADLELKT